jgi:hypothetical protein
VSERAVGLTVRNDDPHGVRYACASLESFVEHHTRFASEVVVYLAEVDPRGAATPDLERALRKRAPRLRFEVCHVGHPLLRSAWELRRSHALRELDLVGDALLAYALGHSSCRHLLALGRGAIFVRDDAVAELCAALAAQDAWIAAPGGGLAGTDGSQRLAPAVLLADLTALRARFPLEPFASPRTMEDRLRVFSDDGTRDALRRARALDLVTVLARWSEAEHRPSRLLDFDRAGWKVALGPRGSFATGLLVGGAWMEVAGRDDLEATVAGARLEAPRRRLRAFLRKYTIDRGAV